MEYIKLTRADLLSQPFTPDAKAVALFQGRADYDTQRAVLMIFLMVGSIINHLPKEAQDIMAEYAENCFLQLEEKIRKESN